MRRSTTTPRPAPPEGDLDPAALAEAARELAATLPALARRAESGGLQLVAQHLKAAQRLAERVAAAGAPRLPRA